MIAATGVLERGTNLWPSKHAIDSSDDPWNTVIPTANFGAYIPHYRFKAYKQFIAKIWESEELLKNGDPWWQFEKAIIDFNHI